MPTCKSNSITINYEVYGRGFPLILSHGFTANLDIWAPQIKAFSNKYQLVVYDARGHGLSTAPAGEMNYSLENLVEDLANLINHLGIQKAYVGGLSMGGATALGYISRYPDKVASLLIFDIDGGFQPYDAEAEAFMTKMWRENEIIATKWGMVELARHRITSGTAPRPVLQNKELQEKFLKRMAMMSTNGYIGIGRALPWKAAWLRKVAKDISVPTLIIVGGDDEVLKTGVKMLREHIKGSRYVEIKGCVHGTAEWYPDIFNSAVLNFLEDVEARRSIGGATVLG